MRGFFLSLEGVDGAGKSSHLPQIEAVFQAAGYTVVQTREPGGTPLSEQIRDLLLHQEMHLDTELLLMFSARQEHLQQVVRPALAAGQAVVCDRFTDSTYAYQGGGRGASIERIDALAQWVHADLWPDLTILFDVPLEVARERLLRTRQLDRFEQEEADFFERVRHTYLARAAAAPERFFVVDSQAPMAQVAAQLEATLTQRVIAHQQGGV